MRNRRLIVAIALSMGWATHAGGQSSTVPGFSTLDSMEARVQGCVTCHGRNGEGANSGYFPRIAGKPAGYLYNQLAAFRDGTRQYPPMNYLVAYLPDAYLREMANYYAKLRPPFEARDAAPADVAMLERGKVIATAGDPRVGIPPCIACHAGERTPALLNTFGLWVGMMIALTIVNYGFPIVQLASLPGTAVPAISVGGP